jgi:hypothetical protein
MSGARTVGAPGAAPRTTLPGRDSGMAGEAEFGLLSGMGGLGGLGALRPGIGRR